MTNTHFIYIDIQVRRKKKVTTMIKRRKSEGQFKDDVKKTLFSSDIYILLLQKTKREKKNKINKQNP